VKLYISADLEGVCGVTSWSETELNNKDSIPFINQWTNEIKAVCEVAIEKGYDEIYLKDAHDTGRNLLPNLFPEEVKLLRGWSQHPYSMVEGINTSFDAAVFVGYHSKAYSNTSPLSHTSWPRIIRYIKINGNLASEFLIYYYTCLYEKVPLILLTGDEGICNDAKLIDEDIETVATKKGFGAATINENPIKVINNIKESAKKAFSSPVLVKQLPENFDVEVCFKKHDLAYRASFYKGATLLEDGFTIKYSTDDYFDVLRLFTFIK